MGKAQGYNNDQAILTFGVLTAQRRSSIMGTRIALQCVRRGLTEACAGPRRPGEGEANSGLVVMGESQEDFPEEVAVGILKAEGCLHGRVERGLGMEHKRQSLERYKGTEFSLGAKWCVVAEAGRAGGYGTERHAFPSLAPWGRDGMRLGRKAVLGTRERLGCSLHLRMET